MTGSDRRSTLSGPLGAVLALATLSGCAVLPEYHPPVFAFAERYTAAPAGVPVLLDNAAWWRRFDDPVLDTLVETALQGNLDLASARERVTEARALAGTVPDGFSATGDGAARHLGGSDTATETGLEASLGLGWLLDPYGGRKAQRAAAAARIEAADAELDAARLIVLSTLTGAYIDLRHAQYALELRRRELRSRRQTLQFVRQMMESGVATRLDLVLAEALVSETQSMIPELEADARILQHEITALLGRAPGRLGISLAGPGGQPHPDLAAEIGIPSDLLRNRPDIRIAERLYYAAVSDIGAARAELYPALSLSGTITLSAFDGVEETSYGFGPSVRLPALPAGPRRALVAAAESRARQAHAAWTAAVLGAVRDVETALARYAGSRARVQASSRTVRLYSQTVGLTRDLIAGGEATVRDLLESEQSVAAARVALAQGVRALARDFVVLNVSLGSGNGYEATSRPAPGN